MKVHKRNIQTLSVMAIFVVAFLATMTMGCIHNDIPYPRIQAGFETFNVVGQTQGTQIDSIRRAITVYISEEVDIENVQVESYTLTPEGAYIVSPDLSQPINLSRMNSITVALYQDYLWTIKAVQNIERYFTVEGQMGASTIDVPGHRVVAYVTENADIKSLLVESMKLGPNGSTYSPNLEGQKVDFSSPVTVAVTNHGRTEQWTIYVEVTQSTVTTTHVDAWSCVAWAYGEGIAGRNNRFQYRLAGDATWVDVPDEWVTHEGGTFTARIIHLSPMTKYEVRACSDDETANVVTFTTQGLFQMPNSDFDSWWLNGKIWNPWPEGGEQYWDTGNKGATTLGSSNSVPTDETVSGTGWAAKLETRFVGIGAIGKLAAGNIFVGSYVRTEGTNGVLSFGRPCNYHPTKVRGWYKYHTAPISSTTAGFHDIKGQPDTCVVWCALIDSDAPFEIRTAPSNRQLFDPNGPYVVAYGYMQKGENVDEYTPFEFELKYTSTSRTPKYILFTASASKYGDYFTGGNGAVMYIDDVVLEYDY